MYWAWICNYIQSSLLYIIHKNTLVLFVHIALTFSNAIIPPHLEFDVLANLLYLQLQSAMSATIDAAVLNINYKLFADSIMIRKIKDHAYGRLEEAKAKNRTHWNT